MPPRVFLLSRFFIGRVTTRYRTVFFINHSYRFNCVYAFQIGLFFFFTRPEGWIYIVLKRNPPEFDHPVDCRAFDAERAFCQGDGQRVVERDGRHARFV